MNGGRVERPPVEVGPPSGSRVRSFPVHNLVGHPLSEVLFQVGRFFLWLSERAHDGTLPDHEPGTGRG